MDFTNGELDTLSRGLMSLKEHIALEVRLSGKTEHGTDEWSRAEALFQRLKAAQDRRRAKSFR